MGISHFPSGFKGGVVVRGMPVLNSYPGSVFWVDSVHPVNGDGSFNQPYATVALALARCTADNGDIIVCKAKHAETFSAAAALELNKAGVALIGLGAGTERPTFTFDTSTAASLLISAASVTVEGCLFLTALDQLLHPIDITGSDCSLDIEYRDPSTILEAVVAVRAVAVSRLNVKIRHRGQTGGSHSTAILQLNGCSGVNVDLDAYGKYSTAAVNFVTTACTNVKVGGSVYNSGTTDGTKLVIDTVTGSTWYCDLNDTAAGARISGGSGAALSFDDVSTIAANQAVATADGTANALQRDVIGNKTDAAVLTVGTTKSLLGYIKGVLTYQLVATADGAANTSAADVIGNKTDAVLTAIAATKSLLAYVKTALQNIGFLADAAVSVIGTTNSLMSYIKGILDVDARFSVSATAVMVNGNTLFTITGGPILIEALWSECITGNDATASTLQYQSAPTIGTPTTISAASASLANAAAGATVALQGTALATAALYAANGPNLIANPGTVAAPAGTLKAVVGVGSTTGTWRHRIRYKALAAGVTVT